MRQVDWEDLRHFTALANSLNLGRAADHLGTSQVTVMRRVKALESALGATLFLRRRDGHRLTDAGIELLRSSREVSHLIDQGAQSVRARDLKAAGRVRIATTELAANWILLPALPAFVAANPDMTLEIDASPDALRLTDDAETIALRFHRPDNGALRIRKLGEIVFGLYGRRGGAGAKSFIDWSGAFADIGLARWLRRLYPDVRPALTLTTFDGHLRAACAGIGATALPGFVAQQFPALSQIKVPEPPLILEAWIVVPDQIASLAKVRKTIRFISGAIEAVSSK